MIRRFFPLLLISLFLSNACLAEMITHSLTSETNDTWAPDLATSPWGYSMLVYTVSGDPLLNDFVRVIPFASSVGCLWGVEDPVTLASGSLGKICWGRTRYHAAVVSGPVVLLRHTDESGNWDLTDEVILSPNGEIISLDIWGDPSTTGEGADAFLVVETRSNQSNGEYHVQFASHDEEGWSELETLVSGSEIRPYPQVTRNQGSFGVWPVVFFHNGQSGASQLSQISKYSSGVWSSPWPIAQQCPVAGEFDVVSMEGNKRSILGLGMQPTCPCGTVHYQASRYGSGWLSAENMTVNQDDFDWPMSPRIAYDPDGVIHAFWYQQASAEDLTPSRKTLEYYVWVCGNWVNNSNAINEPGNGGPLGSELAIAVEPSSRPVLAWTRRDTLDGIPQPQQIYIARHFIDLFMSPVPQVPETGLQLFAWPNPFNPTVKIAFEIEESRAVQLNVFDARGLRVARLLDEVVEAGREVVDWNGTDDMGRQVSSGVYFAQVVSGQERAVTKLVLTE